MKKLLVTGAGGFLGSRVVEAYRASYEVLTFPRGFLRAADQEAVRAYVLSVRPDYIAHLAAISDIGQCEHDPNASWRANVLLTEWLCGAAKEIGAKLVCISSDQVYTGFSGNGPFAETDTAIPANVYARHKLEAERRALSILPDTVLLRATWMYDLPLYGGENRGNFLVNLLRAAATDTPLSFERQAFRGITYARQAAALLEKAFLLPGGAYNYGSENALNMYDTAVSLLCALGMQDRVRALLIPSAGCIRGNLWMNCEKARRGGIAFDTTAEGFARCARDYGLV